MLDYDSKTDSQLGKIKNEVLDCKKCQLYKTRTYPVIGQGNHQTKIVIVGEAPGSNEDKTGRPFCGQAGNILDELLSLVGIRRKEIYITNILKCRPPNNRNPSKDEIKACHPYLLRQLEIIKPKIICCLGNFATQFIMEKFGLTDKIEGISKIHGQIFVNDDLKIISLYHPAVVTYNTAMKEVLENDFKILKKL